MASSCCPAAGDDGDDAAGVGVADVDAVKFTQVLRGYKTSEGSVLERLGRELGGATSASARAIHASLEDAAPSLTR